MAITYVEIDDRYKPKTENETIIASVVIGDAGVGAYVIFLDKALKGANKFAELGKKSDVINKKTIVSATVPDVLDETNWTSVTVKIKEGENEKLYGPYSKEVANNLDTVCFIIKILNTNEI